MRLIQIVPELPPAVGGVGDYAWLLAQGLQRLGIETHFVLCDRSSSPALGSGCAAARGSLVPLRAGALAQCLDTLRPDAVLLHYSGYGFARRGAPVWLAHGLRRWRTAAPHCRLVVMFHELWAPGGLAWQSSFWLLPLQERVALSLARLADVCLTNCSLYQRMLRRSQPDLQEIRVLPVPSNVGEPGAIGPFLQREPAAVVFGQAKRRLEVYRRMPGFLTLLQRAGVRTLDDIGPPLRSDVHDALPVTVRVHGIAAPAQVSALLSKTRFGLLALPSNLLAKSGCFAAFAAHGTVCLLCDDAQAAADGLLPGLHFVRVSPTSHDALDQARFEAVAVAAFLWYSEHRLENITGEVARALCRCAC